MSEAIRCLSVQQPWAWAIVSGLKDIENRSWTTDYRGPIVVHASATKTVVNRIVKTAGETLPTISFAYGAFVGVADLVDVVALSPALESNPWAGGPVCWHFANARTFKQPVPGKGKLNLFALPKEAAALVQEALSSAQPSARDELLSAWANHLSRLGPEAERVSELCGAYIQLGDGTNALRLAEQAVQLSGDADTYADRAIAKILLPEPGYQSALIDLDHAIEIDPGNGRAFHVRGLVHQELGMSSEAKTDAARARELGFEVDDREDGAKDGD